METNLTDLYENEDLFFRLKVFIYDLLKFNIDALSILSSIYPEYYFTNYHFTDDEIEFLFNIQIQSDNTTFKDLYDVFIKGISGKTYICTSHDIAPFIYNSFCINKNFIKDKSFIKRYKKFRGI